MCFGKWLSVYYVPEQKWWCCVCWSCCTEIKQQMEEKVEFNSFLMSSLGDCCGLDGERTWWRSCVRSHFVVRDVECIR